MFSVEAESPSEFDTPTHIAARAGPIHHSLRVFEMVHDIERIRDIVF
jgi:hypothetical protein